MPRVCADRLIMFFVIGLVAWAIIGLPIYYSLQEIPRQQQPQGATATQQQSDSTAPLPVPAQETNPGQHQRNADDKKDTATDHLLKWIATFFEIKLTDALIAIFTIVLAVKTAGLFRETAGLRTAADQQASDMRASIKAAEAAAAAAKRSAEAAEKAFIATDRPWIAIKTEIIGPLRFTDKEVQATIKFISENIGRSPALHVQFGMVRLCPSILEANQYAREAADNAKYMFPGTVIGGPVLFPQEKWEREFDLSLKLDIFIKAKDDFLAPEEDLLKSLPRPPPEDIKITGLDPGIAVCIYYGLPTGGQSHYSIVLSEIRSTDEKHMGYDGGPGEFFNVKVVQSFGGKAN